MCRDPSGCSKLERKPKVPVEEDGVGGRRTRLVGLAFGLGLACAPRPLQRPSLPTRIVEPIPGLATLDVSPLRGRRILLDPGHGGAFGGAQGPAGTREADVNLGVALHLWGMLRDAGADVHLTRSSDRDLLPAGATAVRDDLAARIATLDSLQAEVFLSLHHNSSASLDRERDAIETYFRLDDDGPSFDLGRALHARLVRHLGVPRSELRPGNYFVLRGSSAPAVLGEARYISNPSVETELNAAAAQRREATAYFLGLLDYFAAGVDAIARVAVNDTLPEDGVVVFRLGSRALAVDPLSVTVHVDGNWITPGIAADATHATLPRLAPGVHAIAVAARTTRGNALRPWKGRVVVTSKPERFTSTQDVAGTLRRVRLRIENRNGDPVADGTAIRLHAGGAEMLDTDSLTHAGEAQCIVRPLHDASHLDVDAAGVACHVLVPIDRTPNDERFVRCVDARTRASLQDVWVMSEPASSSDRRGWVRAQVSAGPVWVQRAGYASARLRLPQEAGVIALEPLHGGVLHARRYVLDPAPPADAAPGAPPHPVTFEACRHASALLEAAGARVRVTGSPSAGVIDAERIRAASDADAFVRIALGTVPVAEHFPGSSGGAALARALARAIAGAVGVDSIPVRPASRWVLQQTPCPAVDIVVPISEDDGAARRVAAALSVGLRLAQAPETARLPPLVGHVQGAPPGALVLLDGAETVPVDAHGAFRFEAVSTGHHILTLAGDANVIEIQVTGRDTTRVDLPAHVSPVPAP